VQREIERETAQLVNAEDALEVFVPHQRSVRISVVECRSCELSVVALSELFQQCVARVAIADALEAQLFYEPVLQRLICTLDATLGSR
jgi:hypothetical protein